MRHVERDKLKKIGFFGFVMTLILVFFIVLIGKENGLFELHTNAKAIIKNAENLKTGANVQFKGINIGTIKDINIEKANQVILELDLMDKYIKWIPKDSKVKIATAGLVGDKILEIREGVSDESFNPLDDEFQQLSEINLDTFIQKGGSIADSTSKVVIKLEKILENIDEADLGRAIKNLSQMMDELNKKKFAKNLSSTMKDLSQSSKKINKGPGTLNSLIYKDDLHNQLIKLFDGANRNKAVKYLIRDSIKNSKK
jgi:phospholipid/cholesterol/gamma-HCH transport system substrate-binding protein